MDKSILLIDDDPEDCAILKEHLEDAGWNDRIFAVHDGLQAVNLLHTLAIKNELPSLILVDLNMPKMGGLETLKSIKEKYTQITVVVYSTACSQWDVQTALELGAHSCIKKPSSFAEGDEFARKLISLTA